MYLRTSVYNLDDVLTRKLKHFSSEVLQYRTGVDSGFCSNTHVVLRALL